MEWTWNFRSLFYMTWSSSLQILKDIRYPVHVLFQIRHVHLSRKGPFEVLKWQNEQFGAL